MPLSWAISLEILLNPLQKEKNNILLIKNPHLQNIEKLLKILKSLSIFIWHSTYVMEIQCGTIKKNQGMWVILSFFWSIN